MLTHNLPKLIPNVLVVSKVFYCVPNTVKYFLVCDIFTRIS